MQVSNLNDVFVVQLKDLYSAEKLLAEALPKMAEKVSSDELKNALTMHLEQTKEQTKRLEQIGTELKLDLKGEKCDAMEGIIKEGQKLLKDNSPNDALDAALIASAQRAEHYEIAAYGSACTYAESLGQQKALELLKMTLNEEEQTDKKLTRIAETSVNQQAKSIRG